MRWTRGKPASKAPAGVPLLVAFDNPDSGAARYVTAKVRVETWHYGDGENTTPMERRIWAYLDGRHMEFAPDRFWILPGDAA